MIHKIKDGDKIKILPFIVDGKFKWGKEYTMLIHREKIICDCEKVFETMRDLANFEYKLKYHNRPEKLYPIVYRYVFNAYINNKFEIVNIGAGILRIIRENIDTTNLYDDKHIFIKEVPIYINGKVFLDYSKSTVESHTWNQLNNSDVEWLDWIEHNQPDYLVQSSVWRNIDLVTNIFGTDVVNKVLSEKIDERISEVIF